MYKSNNRYSRAHSSHIRLNKFILFYVKKHIYNKYTMFSRESKRNLIVLIILDANLIPFA